MKSKNIYIFIIILVAAALSVGYVSFKNNAPRKVAQPTNQDLPTITPAPPEDIPYSSEFLSSLTPEEQKIITNPGNLSDKDRALRYEFIVNNAEAADQLSLLNCIPQPFILEGSTDNDITVKNLGEADVVFTINAKSHAIPAEGSVILPAGFIDSLGDFAYSCGKTVEDRQGTGIILFQ